MKNIKNINQQAIEIQRRFFEAIELAKTLKRTSGIKEFCITHNLNRTKYYRVKSLLNKPPTEMHYKSIDIDALHYLCRDFGVSPTWLLLGKGELKIR